MPTGIPGVENIDLKDAMVSQASSLSSFESASPLPLPPVSLAASAFGNIVPAGTQFPKFVLPNFAGGLPNFSLPSGLPGLGTQSVVRRPAAGPIGVKTTSI